MVYQTNSNGLIAYKKQSGLGTPASGSSANQLRIAGGNGLKLSKAAVQSNEVRNDGMSVRGRHGTQAVAATYTAEGSLGSHDPIIEAIMGATWDATGLTASNADFTSVTTAADGLVFASGNPITKGFRAGDVIRTANLSDAGNNAKNLRIASLSSTKITTAEPLIVNGTPDTSFTITRPGKRLINPATRARSYFTLEEYEGDIDRSTIAQDFIWGSLKFSMGADGLLTVESTGTGTGNIQALATGSSPYFTSPVATSDVPFAVVDATIRLAGVDLVELTSFDLTANIQPTAPKTFGSQSQKYSPDVFPGSLLVSMNMTALRKDLAHLADFIAETPYSLHILAVDNTAEPKDFLSIVVPNFTLGSVDPSAFSKQGGARTETIQIPAALVGIDTSATGNNSMISFQTSAA